MSGVMHTKVGVNLAGDAAKLKTDFGWELAGRIDLAELATTRCFAHRCVVSHKTLLFCTRA
eukprot:1158949-Pelagomonas_calceolata.AAC.6